MGARGGALDQDQLGLSNDVYYASKAGGATRASNSLLGPLVQHSTPANELYRPWFPTAVGASKLRVFHRRPLKKYSSGPMASNPETHKARVGVVNLAKHIRRKAKVPARSFISLPSHLHSIPHKTGSPHQFDESSPSLISIFISALWLIGTEA